MANAKRPDEGVGAKAKKNLANLKKGYPLGPTVASPDQMEDKSTAEKLGFKKKGAK